MISFSFADLHCHPNLKTFGHSFDKSRSNNTDVWHSKPSGLTGKILNRITGITRFSQADFTSMVKGNVKLAFVSLYPFEKGFFLNSLGKSHLSALLSDFATDIGYNRVRHLQNHSDYFQDLSNEYLFFTEARKENQIENTLFSWELIKNWSEAETCFNKGQIAVVFTIEGAHVFNTGLEIYGKKICEAEVMKNVEVVKNWRYKPFFITFAHNFNNQLCGHAKSLEPLGNLVDQKENLNGNFSPLGMKVIHKLLEKNDGRRILIDIKHMSVASRKEYYSILHTEYCNEEIPIICSHGAVNGLSFSGTQTSTLFNNSDLNLFDEEIIEIVKTGGLLAIQFDVRILGGKNSIKSFFRKKRIETKHAALLIWNQLKYIAEISDTMGYFGWGNTCIGSDFDGTINPPAGLTTVKDYPLLGNELLLLANNYLKQRKLYLKENREITPEELVQNFAILNTLSVLKKHY